MKESLNDMEEAEEADGSAGRNMYLMEHHFIPL